MHTELFVLLSLFVVLFGIVSGRIERSVFTPPMLFAGFGLLVGPPVLGVLHLEPEAPFVHLIAEFTLVIVLFIDASRIDLSVLRHGYRLPLRMLAIGMPLTILGGALIGLVLFTELNIWQAALLATILAPTDAALGQAVVSSPRVPVAIRQTLNVESGLNDGIALPVVMILASCSGMAAGTESASYWTAYTAKQVLLGPLVGIVVGYVGGKVIEYATHREWVSESFQRLTGLALAFLAFSGAEVIGGNGFIAAFVAGLTLGNATRALCSCFYHFTEAEGQLLALIAFMIFGAVMVGPAFAHLSLTVVLYAVLSLTLVRMVPVALSMLGTGVRGPTTFFLGWFGPRGLASILFALLILERSDIPHRHEIFQIVMITVLFSIVAHGLTAVPAAKRYGRFTDELAREEAKAVEHHDHPELPLRILPQREAS